jgi:uncharacterized protein YdeI (YjbR/CyaY-like superfamily)
LKWGQACYTLANSNIVLIHGFNEYCALLFFKGALMSDPHHVLIQQTKNVQVPRQLRFTSLLQITEQESIIEEYIHEAVKVEKSGVKVEMKTTADFAVADEFQSKLDKIPALKAAFESLTPGRQKGYLLHFSQPKQSKTREARVEKYIPQILAGKGLED